MFLSLKCRHLPSYAVITFRKLQSASVSTHVRIQFTFGHLCFSIPRNSVGVQTTSHWNLIDHCMASPLPVLSPSSILPPLSSHCAFVSARKDSGCVWKKYYLNSFCVFFKPASLETCMGQVGSARFTFERCSVGPILFLVRRLLTRSSTKGRLFFSDRQPREDVFHMYILNFF
jgi:hypothetical protein